MLELWVRWCTGEKGAMWGSQKGNHVRRAKNKDMPAVPIEMESLVLARDSDALIGTIDMAGVTHAVIDLAASPVMYCRTTKEILSPVNKGTEGIVTCSMCKEKLRTELG